MDLHRHIIYMRRIKRGRFGERDEVHPRCGHRPRSTDKLYSRALLHLLHFTQENRSDLSGGPSMGAAASGQIEFSDVDQPKLSRLLRRKLANATLPRFFQAHEADVHCAVFGDDLIRQLLRGLNLDGRERFRLQVDRAALDPHVKAHGGNLKHPHDRPPQHMLPPILLHPPPPPPRLNPPPPPCPPTPPPPP